MTTTTEQQTYEITAIPAEVFAAARRGESADPIVAMTATGGEPVRCCLRDARPGEQLLLFNYQPPLPAAPYRETGAVFGHAEACPGPDSQGDGYPSDWIGRPQVLRAYDERGWIHPASRTHDGSDPSAALADILTDPDVVEVHSRNVVYGCYMFTARRR